MTDSDKFYEVESAWSIKQVVGDNEDICDMVRELLEERKWLWKALRTAGS